MLGQVRSECSQSMHSGVLVTVYPLTGEVGELQHRSRQQVPPLMLVETCEQMGSSLSKRFVCKQFSSPTLQG
jgi:hypothetical protein